MPALGYILLETILWICLWNAWNTKLYIMYVKVEIVILLQFCLVFWDFGLTPQPSQFTFKILILTNQRPPLLPSSTSHVTKLPVPFLSMKRDICWFYQDPSTCYGWVQYDWLPLILWMKLPVVDRICEPIE